MEYIIVQAGGKGTRLGRLTQNKPKALVPVENLPMLFHLFRNEYSCAVKPHIRAGGNRQSGIWETAIASLLA